MVKDSNICGHWKFGFSSVCIFLSISLCVTTKMFFISLLKYTGPARQNTLRRQSLHIRRKYKTVHTTTIKQSNRAKNNPYRMENIMFPPTKISKNVIALSKSAADAAAVSWDIARNNQKGAKEKAWRRRRRIPEKKTHTNWRKYATNNSVVLSVGRMHPNWHS